VNEHVISSPVFSPDGHFLAYAEGEKSLKLLHLGPDYLPAGPAATLVQEPRPIVQIKWTDDGKWIIYEALGDGGEYKRRIAPQAGAQAQPIPGHEVSQPVESSSSPDGRQQVFISTRTGLSEIHGANADGTNDRVLVPSVPEYGETRWDIEDEVPHLAGWSPDGKWIAIKVHPLFGGHGTDYDNLYVILASGGPPRLVAEDIHGFEWSPDSQSIDLSYDYFRIGTRRPPVRVDISDLK